MMAGRHTLGQGQADMQYAAAEAGELALSDLSN